MHLSLIVYAYWSTATLVLVHRCGAQLQGTRLQGISNALERASLGVDRLGVLVIDRHPFQPFLPSRLSKTKEFISATCVK
jgi:hypothetical protein